MPGVLLALELIDYALVLWLGLYLINRDPRSMALWLAALGLMLYAGALGIDFIQRYAREGTITGDWSAWRKGLMIMALAAALFSLNGIKALIGGRTASCKLADWILFAGVFLFYSASLAVLVGVRETSEQWLLLVAGGGVFVLGTLMAQWHAHDQHEALWPDYLRSVDYSMLAALFFGGQVGLVIVTSSGATPSMLALLLCAIGSAMSVFIFFDRVQSALDKYVLARFPQLQRTRADLRAVNAAVPRADTDVDFETMDEAEFVRLTRRALSHLGDLPRLAASPLMYLPTVEARLMERDLNDNTLARAGELKRLLTESISALKPDSGIAFGTMDEWRHYNALYFPYVLGLKPYSLRLHPDEIDPATRDVLVWFRAAVPERTLHNWQNAAAKLVAQYLREQEAEITPVRSSQST